MLQVRSVRFVPDASTSMVCLAAPVGAVAQPTPEPQAPRCPDGALRTAIRFDATNGIVLPMRVNGMFWRNELVIKATDLVKLAFGSIGVIVVGLGGNMLRDALAKAFARPLAALVRRFRRKAPRPKRGRRA